MTVGEIQASKVNADGIGNTWYDQIALSVVNGVGNIHLGAYEDSSGPNTLLVDSGSIASPASSSYTYQAVTEYQITTVRVWLAFNASNGAFTQRTANNSIAGFRKGHTQSYAALDNPFGTVAYTDAYPVVMKTKHS